MLTTHLARTINRDPRLLRILGVKKVTDTTDWEQIAHTTQHGAVPGERALALCLCGLAGVDLPNSFGYWFEHLNGADMRAIITLLDTYAEATTTTETAAQSTRPLFEV